MVYYDLNDMGDMDMGNGEMMYMGNFKLKFWVVLVLMILIIIMSLMMGVNLLF